jgi:hypothetical protein
MSTVLMQACNQWMTRPADERFASLADLHAAVMHHREVSVEAPTVALRSLSVATEQYAEGEEPIVQGSTGAKARLTHYSFGQLARVLGAPASYLRTLPPSLAAENLQHGLAKVDDDERQVNMLFAQNGDLRLRAMTSDKYTRIWNSDITRRLIALTEQSPEWQPAPAAFDGSRGLYASDKDMFAFLVDNDRRIFDKLPGGGLGRGFFVSNSEVGDASFRVTTFLYEYVCGNHRVWGAQGVSELRIPHIGDADERAFRKMAVELRKFADASSQQDEARIEACMKYEFEGTKDELLDAVFGLNTGLTRKMIGAGFDRAVEQEARYGSPKSVWGLAGGITEIARDLPNADERVTVERQAGKLMQIAF